MSRRRDFGLARVVDCDCIACGVRLILTRRTVEGEVKGPPACPKCGQACQKKDDGRDIDRQTGKEFVRYRRTEITSAQLAREGERVPSDFYTPE